MSIECACPSIDDGSRHSRPSRPRLMEQKRLRGPPAPNHCQWGDLGTSLRRPLEAAECARARGRRRRRPLHGRHHVKGHLDRHQLRVTRRRWPLRRDGGPEALAKAVLGFAESIDAPPPDHSMCRLDELDSRTARTTGFKRDSEVPLMRRERAKDRARNKRRHTLQ